MTDDTARRSASGPAPDTDGQPWVLRSEFARVAVRLDDRGNGPRLRVTDLTSGAEIHLDPLELASLARSRHEQLEPLIMTEELTTETDAWALDPH